MRPKRFSEKSTQVRLTIAAEHKLKAISERVGADVSTILRLAVNSGLTSIAKSLPSTPAIEDDSNASPKGGTAS